MSSTTVELPLPLIRDTPAPARFSLGYCPALDGLRGIAILAVLAVHTNHLFGWSLLPGGNIGVDIFFTLSGYLITRLLLEERTRTGTISLWNFYWRRILRLIPALLIVVTVLFFVADLVFPASEAEQTHQAIPIALVYASDLAMAFSWKVPLGALQHTWSLAIEEHFYLLWPPMLIMAIKFRLTGRKLLVGVLILALAAATERFLLSVSGASALRTYYGIDGRADGLLIGCAVGIAVTWGFARSFRLFSLPLVILLVLMASATNYSTPFMHYGGFTLVAIATAILLVNITSEPSTTLSRMLEFSPLVWIGKISYGIYLWHYPVFRAVGHLQMDWSLKLLIGIAVTFSLSGASYYLIEKPALRLKSRFC
jgi:peptidoglycan/LPS O-acetylase OafA/YrhL